MKVRCRLLGNNETSSIVLTIFFCPVFGWLVTRSLWAQIQFGRSKRENFINILICDDRKSVAFVVCCRFSNEQFTFYWYRVLQMYVCILYTHKHMLTTNKQRPLQTHTKSVIFIDHKCNIIEVNYNFNMIINCNKYVFILVMLVICVSRDFFRVPYNCN